MSDRTGIASATQYQASRMIRLFRPGYGYVHLSGKGYAGIEHSWCGFKYQARNLMASMPAEEAEEIVFRRKEGPQ